MNTRKENVINIDGSKLKALLEGATGKTLKEISLENGFSDSFLRMVVKSGKATPTAQAVIKLYGIEPSAYEVKPETPETEPATSDDKQLTIDDILEPTAKDLLKEFIYNAVGEALTRALNNTTVRINNKEGYVELFTKDPFSVAIIGGAKPNVTKDNSAGDKWAI